MEAAEQVMRAHWLTSREIIERVVVEGTLVLETPTSLGNGDAEGITDISLLLEALEGRALLTGASIAGALRNYLRERLLGYEREEFVYTKRRRIPNDLSIVTRLFGSLEEDGEQSYLIIDDALAEPPQDYSGKAITKDGHRRQRPSTELRDGVRIEGKTRTAYVDAKGKGAKFDLELLDAGTAFPLRFELLISQHRTAPSRARLLEALATALQGFERGEIALGGRKRRGYGLCRVRNWQVIRYDLKSTPGLLAWLSHDLAAPEKVGADSIASAVRKACKLRADNFQPDNDHRARFTLTARFALMGSLLIRSGSLLTDTQGRTVAYQPDDVHLHSRRISNGQVISAPILSGTALAGALRHRAFRIALTLACDGKDSEEARENAQRFIDRLFGADIEALKKSSRDHKTPLAMPVASRLEIREVMVNHVHPLVQHRVRIDRFTGGAYESALFNAAPVFAPGGEQAIEITLTLRVARSRKLNGHLETETELQTRTHGEIGLLLLLLKDLWTSDLALGGEASVGRGRLCGHRAVLTYRSASQEEAWTATVCQEAQEAALPTNRIAVTGIITKKNGQVQQLAYADLEACIQALHRQLGRGTLSEDEDEV